MADYPWMIAAKKLIGTVEGPGAKNNPTVVAMFAKVKQGGITQDAVPWCAAFVGACLEDAGIKSTRTLWALDYRNWGDALKVPIYGCVASKRRNGGGHVGFVVGANASSIILLGGNQNDAVSIASFPREDFVAYRWPPRIPKLDTPLPTTVAGAKLNVREA